MFKWLKTAVSANKERRRCEILSGIRSELASALLALPPDERNRAVSSILSASELSKDLIEKLIKSVSPDTIVQITFRDGSVMTISGRPIKSKAGPGW